MAEMNHTKECGYTVTLTVREYDALKSRVYQLEAALKRIILKDGRESIAVTKICDIARRALAGNTLGLEHPSDRSGAGPSSVDRGKQ